MARGANASLLRSIARHGNLGGAANELCLSKGAVSQSLQELERRIAMSGDRGIAAEKGVSLASIDAVRRPLYRQYAHIHIPCAGNKGGVVQRILDALTDWHAQEL